MIAKACRKIYMIYPNQITSWPHSNSLLILAVCGTLRYVLQYLAK